MQNVNKKLPHNMTDDNSIKLFCTEWLLQSDCSRGTNCIFIHANMRDITLCDELTDEEVFVKGSYNQGWRKKVKSKRGRPRGRNFHQRQNGNRDSNSNHKYATRSNSNRFHEANPPSTSTNQYVTSNASSSSTGACKKVINNNRKYAQHIFNSNTSESEDENSKNLPNLQFAKQKDWSNSSEIVPKNVKNSLLNKGKDRSETNNSETTKCISPKDEKKDTEVAGALSEPQEKVCGICFEVVMEKIPYERKFGILPNCNHCFCLTCIRKWRQAKQFENSIIRACPECRVTSDFVCPSSYWADTVSEKETLISNYKKALSKKDCKYFRKGVGSCPFGNKCFYLHALNDGTKVDVGPPPSQRFGSALNDELDLFQKMVLLEYVALNVDCESDSDSDDDDDLFEYMFWSSDDDLCFF
ncbi:zinc finger protein [Oryctes borbonicus]|uniref:RING-type E3 ubiquitin transferase n=1 Tax=Oryctes borbonicus TaxID=1629725 RepID=A0A0T6B013_9SCAR|nr:zinc finger protein [Oryctes borbonicus]